MEYTIIVAKLFYGLPRDTFRKLVYQYAVACKKSNIPEVWKVSQSATHDWYYAFMLRHPNLALKEPEGMSIARIVAFNKVNVDKFFDALTLALEKYEITPDRIYNLDESALATVMKCENRALKMATKLGSFTRKRPLTGPYSEKVIPA